MSYTDWLHMLKWSLIETSCWLRGGHQYVDRHEEVPNLGTNGAPLVLDYRVCSRCDRWDFPDELVPTA